MWIGILYGTIYYVGTVCLLNSFDVTGYFINIDFIVFTLKLTQKISMHVRIIFDTAFMSILPICSE